MFTMFVAKVDSGDNTSGGECGTDTYELLSERLGSAAALLLFIVYRIPSVNILSPRNSSRRKQAANHDLLIPLLLVTALRSIAAL